MKTRILDNGYKIHQADSPLCHGHHIYYVQGGLEGFVQVFDTFMTPLSVVSACMAWETDEPKRDCGNEPKCEFNMRVMK